MIIYHFRRIMNRSGLGIVRIFRNPCLHNSEILPSTSLQLRHYHPVVNTQETLKFAPRHICFEPNRRFFFSTKETKAEADGAKKEAVDEEAKEVPEAERVLQEKLAEIEEKNSDLLDKYKRSLADFENLRNRMNKQVADAKMFGIQGFCKVTLSLSIRWYIDPLQDLLDVADVLNKAISSVPDTQLKESQSLKDLHQGLQLTESQLLKVFSKHGLVQENPLGEKFDPNKHDALFQVMY